METKTELVDKIAELEAANKLLEKKVEEQKHLAEAIDAKDAQLSKTIEKFSNEVKEKDKEISRLNERLVTKNKTETEEKEMIIKVLSQALQMYQNTFRAFLKNVQGGLENAVELDAMLADQLNKSFNKK
jgi:septal ring factor EnvC (AmiA/AmiB activator)